MLNIYIYIFIYINADRHLKYMYVEVGAVAVKVVKYVLYCGLLFVKTFHIKEFNKLVTCLMLYLFTIHKLCYGSQYRPYCVHVHCLQNHRLVFKGQHTSQADTGLSGMISSIWMMSVIFIIFKIKWCLNVNNDIIK